jgi:hypothetical protein
MRIYKYTSQAFTYSQYINPSITATRPTLIPAISFPPFALPFVLDGLAALPVAVPVDADPAAVPVPLTCNVCPTLGNFTSPSTSHPPAVELGHAGGVKLGEYAELATPVGVRVAH